MGSLGKLIAAILVGIFESFMGRLRRDQEKKQEGREEVIHDAGTEADTRKAEAQAMDDEWSRLPPAERERVLNDRKIYRD